MKYNLQEEKEGFFKAKIGMANHFLVTGGAGFIGSHLVYELVKQGHQVTVLDNLSDGTLQNLSGVKENIHFIAGDICQFADVLHACKGVDYILHHAALASVAKSMIHPQLTTQINILGTQNVLEAARQCGVKRVIFASSAAVYGTLPGYPYREDSPTDCQSPYAWSKQAGAELCQLYTQAYGLETVVLRYFNVFGPRQNPNAAVIAQFIRLAAINQPLGIDWDGKQSRDFINVRDVVQANMLAVFKAKAGEVYNVASGTTHSLLELADVIEKISGRRLERTSHAKRPGDVHKSSADIRKIRTLGFEPQVTLEAGLREMWQQATSAVTETTPACAKQTV